MGEIVNVLGRYESCSEWTQRSLFIDLDEMNVTSRAEDQRQALTRERHAMALRLKCGERAALWQNVPNFPFTNAALAKSVGTSFAPMLGITGCLIHELLGVDALYPTGGLGGA